MTLLPDDAPDTPSRVAGTVAGTTSTGQPIVSTPLGTLVLQARSGLPPGTAVQLSIQGGAASFTPPALDPLRGRDWPALKEAMAVLTASDPALAKVVADTLPQPNRRFTRALAQFMGAARGGSAEAWLGGAALEALGRAGRDDVAGRLAEDFRALSRQAAEPLAEGWRSLAVPLLDGLRVERIQLATRRAGEDERGEEAGAGPELARRFLIDLEFTALGAMQLDGLVRGARFDLVVRTAQLLPAELKRDLTGIFTGSVEAVGYAGALTFQTGAHLWVRLKGGGAQARA
ncbi:MAG TPA: hypothetical protein VED40_09800 [Azospirillaceae bacterium]|nr:hypothetical protein [Azospirillaceae bacterium]